MTAALLAEGLGFTEGPVVREDGALIVTAIDRGLLWIVGGDAPQVFAVTGGGPNGATAGADGTIYVAQNGGRGPGWRKPAMSGGIQAVRSDGSIAWITRDPISPNDLCFGPDGLLYVTDPTRRAARDDGRIWRIDVASGEAEIVTSTGWYPNGIGFAGWDDDALYVASTGERSIVRLSLSSPSPGAREVVCRIETGLPDGFAFDVEGNLLVGVNGEDGRSAEIQVWSLDGRLLDRLRPIDARYLTNVALDGQGNLYATCPDVGGVLRLDWPHAGVELHRSEPSVADPGPLAGVRVFDWTIYGVGPFAGVMLGALGADVIKVEQPGGDPQQQDEMRQGGMSTMYINQNLCKRSVVLDLKQEAGRAHALDLLATCDVFLNNMRPGTPERSGLGYDTVSRIAPQIIYCVATGWGSAGPMAGIGGVDLLAQAFSGVAGITGPAGGDPELYRQLGNLDYSASSYIVAAVLEALYARERTGLGADISLSLLEAAVSVQATRLAELLLTDTPAPRLGSSTTTNAPDEAFEAADAKFVAVSVVSDDQWQRLCAALERPGLAERRDLATNAGRVAATDELRRILAPLFGGAHSAWWSVQLTRHQVPHAVVSDFAAVCGHPQVRANRLLVEIPTRWGRVLAGAPPWTFSDSRVGLSSAPVTGEDTASVLRGLPHAGPVARPGPEDAAAGAPFAGLRVLDLSSGIAGPYATSLLARGGADVVKLERPGGDHMRTWEPRTEAGDGAAYVLLNGAKTVIRAASAAAYRPLAAARDSAFDVVVVDAVDAAGRRGPSAARLRRANERAIVCTVSGYGERGPLARVPASELTCQALAAVPAGLGLIGGPPVRIGADIASTVAGIHAFQAISAALLVRERTGRGQNVGVSPLRSMMFLKSCHWGSLANPDAWGVTHMHQSWTRQPNRGYRTTDGRVTFVWYRPDRDSFGVFLDEIGLGERVRDDERFASGPRPTTALGTHGDSCVAIYEAAFASMTTVEVIAALERAGAYAVPVLAHRELIAHPQFQALEILEEAPDAPARRLPRRPWTTRRGRGPAAAVSVAAIERSTT